MQIKRSQTIRAALLLLVSLCCHSGHAATGISNAVPFSAATVRAGIQLNDGITYFWNSNGTYFNRTIPYSNFMPILSITHLGAAGTPTDDTAAFQAALDRGTAVKIPKGDYITGPLTFKSGSYLIGEPGAIIHFKSSSAGIHIDQPDGVTNCGLAYLIFDGGCSTNTAWQSNVFNRAGIRIISQSGQTFLNNVIVSGYPSNGFEFKGSGLISTTYRTMATDITGCHAYDCYVGFRASSSGSQNAEYINFINCYAEKCMVGVSMFAGNNKISGGNLTGNNIGIEVNGGANNPAHGAMTGTTLNHNQASIVCKNFNNGFYFGGCLDYASAQILFSNVCGVVWDGGKLNTTAINNVQNVGGGINILRNYSYVGSGPVVTDTAGNLLNYAYSRDDGTGGLIELPSKTNITVRATGATQASITSDLGYGYFRGGTNGVPSLVVENTNGLALDLYPTGARVLLQVTSNSLFRIFFPGVGAGWEMLNKAGNGIAFVPGGTAGLPIWLGYEDGTNGIHYVVTTNLTAYGQITTPFAAKTADIIATGSNIFVLDLHRLQPSAVVTTITGGTNVYFAHTTNGINGASLNGKMYASGANFSACWPTNWHTSWSLVSQAVQSGVNYFITVTNGNLFRYSLDMDGTSQTNVNFSAEQLR